MAEGDVKARGGVGRGIAWMILLLALLFWLPVFGPFLAGLVGGKKAGSVGRALGAVFLPCLALAMLIFLYTTAFTGLPMFGAFLGASLFMVLLGHVGSLLVGAVIGGFLAETPRAGN